MMLTKFENFDNPDKEPEEITKIIDDIFMQYEQFPNSDDTKFGLLCLESYWDLNLANDLSMKPFLNSLDGMMDKSISVFHRRIESTASLHLYTKFGEGVLFDNPFISENIQVIYLGLHGQPGKLLTSIDDISSAELITAFKDYDKCSNKLIYFGACNVFEGQTGQNFARKFLQETGVHSALGYSNKVCWVDGLIIDMLFLARFFNDPNPFANLQNLYESVINDYRPAQNSGFSLFMNSANNSKKVVKTTAINKAKKV